MSEIRTPEQKDRFTQKSLLSSFVLYGSSVVNAHPTFRIILSQYSGLSQIRRLLQAKLISIIALELNLQEMTGRDKMLQ